MFLPISAFIKYSYLSALFIVLHQIHKVKPIHIGTECLILNHAVLHVFMQVWSQKMPFPTATFFYKFYGFKREKSLQIEQ